MGEGRVMDIQLQTVRYCEKRYLWNCFLYYHTGKGVVSDESHDGDERCLELNREIWSDYFKAHLENPKAPLKPQAHVIKLSLEEQENAHKWAEYVAFIERHCR